MVALLASGCLGGFGSPCDAAADCEGSLECLLLPGGGTCTTPCSSHDQCATLHSNGVCGGPNPFTGEPGYCHVTCESDAHCPSGTVCEGFCRLPP